jgi:hypothetical protein
MRNQHSQADAHVRQRLRIEQAIRSAHRDRNRCEQDQSALESRRQVLGLRMPIGVLLISRLRRPMQGS